MSPEASVFAPAESVLVCAAESGKHDYSTPFFTNVENGLGVPSQPSQERVFNSDVISASEKILTEYPPYAEMKHWHSIADLREGIWYSASEVPMDDDQLHKYFRLRECAYTGDMEFKYRWKPQNHPNISKKELFTIETLRSDSAMWPIALQIEQALEDEKHRFRYMRAFFSAIVQRLYEKKIKEIN